MKKSMIRRAGCSICILLLFLSLVGCSKNSEGYGINSKSDLQANVDPFGIYDKEVTITAARRDFGEEIPVGDDAPWNQLYAEYGIDLKVEWSAGSNQYKSKLNTAIASENLPDLFQVIGAEQMNTLVRADLVADLTEVFEEYASERVKKLYSTEIGNAALESVTFDGKLRFIPIQVTEPLADTNLLYIRKDWLDNLGMDIPQNLEELREVAIAFTYEDPDLNGKDDTYGLAVAGKELTYLNSFFTGFGVYPGAGVDGMLFFSYDESGDVVWDGEKQGTEKALQYLQNLYQAGAIPQDFAVYDLNKVWEDLNQGKAGICIGARGYPEWAIQDTFRNNNEAEWYAMNMLTEDGSDSLLVGFQPTNTALAVSADCEHPEAIIRMLNIVTEMNAPESDMYDSYYLESNRQEAGTSIVYPAQDPEVEKKEAQALFDAYERQSMEGLSGNNQQLYQSLMGFEENQDEDDWSSWNRFYPEEGHSYYVIYHMDVEKEITMNLWQDLPTSFMTSKLAVWNQLYQEALVNTISGNSLEIWNNFLINWKTLGGTEIAEEVKRSLY